MPPLDYTLRMLGHRIPSTLHTPFRSSQSSPAGRLSRQRSTGRSRKLAAVIRPLWCWLGLALTPIAASESRAEWAQLVIDLVPNDPELSQQNRTEFLDVAHADLAASGNLQPAIAHAQRDPAIPAVIPSQGWAVVMAQHGHVQAALQSLGQTDADVYRATITICVSDHGVAPDTAFSELLAAVPTPHQGHDTMQAVTRWAITCLALSTTIDQRRAILNAWATFFMGSTSHQHQTQLDELAAVLQTMPDADLVMTELATTAITGAGPRDHQMTLHLLGLAASAALSEATAAWLDGWRLMTMRGALSEAPNRTTAPIARLVIAGLPEAAIEIANAYPGGVSWQRVASAIRYAKPNGVRGLATLNQHVSTQPMARDDERRYWAEVIRIAAMVDDESLATTALQHYKQLSADSYNVVLDASETALDYQHAATGNALFDSVHDRLAAVRGDPVSWAQLLSIAARLERPIHGETGAMVTQLTNVTARPYDFIPIIANLAAAIDDNALIELVITSTLHPRQDDRERIPTVNGPALFERLITMGESALAATLVTSQPNNGLYTVGRRIPLTVSLREWVDLVAMQNPGLALQIARGRSRAMREASE